MAIGAFGARTIAFHARNDSVLSKSLVVRFAEHQCKNLMCIRACSKTADSWHTHGDGAVALRDRGTTGECRIAMIRNHRSRGDST
jgi:hypothetical protein